MKKNVGFELKTISNLIKRKIINLPEFTENDKLTSMHGWLIGYLYTNQNKEIFQRDIEAVSMLRRSSVTTMLQNMENNGLITREGVAQDARLKKIILTEKSIEMQKKIDKEINLIENQLKQGITDSELKTFFDILEKIKRNLQ